MDKITITSADLPPTQPQHIAPPVQSNPQSNHGALRIAAIMGSIGSIFMFCLCLGCPMLMSGRASANTHPVFNTPIDSSRPTRPAVQVSVLDEREHFFFRAELYLKVQSSRFPGETWVVVPLNGGDFAGCRERFVQLPFAVTEDDVLVFNLLDNDEMTYEQEMILLNGCRAAGYAVVVGGELYCPDSSIFVEPIALSAAEALGTAVIEDVRLHGFENFGTADVRIGELPFDPRHANEVALRSGLKVRATLKLYQPPTELVWSSN